MKAVAQATGKRASAQTGRGVGISAHPNTQVAHSQTAAASSGLINGEGGQPPAACHHLPSALSFPGRQLDKVKAEAQEKGDLGLVAESSRSNQRMMFQPASLTAGGVFRKLKEIASMSGNSVSQTITFSLGEKRTNIFCYIYSVSSVRSRRRRHTGFFFCLRRKRQFLSVAQIIPHVAGIFSAITAFFFFFFFIQLVRVSFFPFRFFSSV